MRPVDVGAPAPALVLRDQHGSTVDLATYRGRVVAVVFFPWAFSRVCSGELRAIRDAAAAFHAAGPAVVAVSCDPVSSLRAFAEAGGLGFPLLSDFWPHGAVARAYGVFDERAGCARRSTFVVDGTGVVRWSVHSPMGRARDAAALRAALARLASVRSLTPAVKNSRICPEPADRT